MAFVFNQNVTGIRVSPYGRNRPDPDFQKKPIG
jgi:hypothetical protein